MKSTLPVKIILPSATILAAEVDMVNLPGEKGVFGVLPGHCNMIANLNNGIVSVFSNEGEQKYFIYAGIAQVTGEGLNILCEFAVNLAKETKTKVMDYIAALNNNLLEQQASSLQRNIILEKLKKHQTLLEFL